MIYIVTISVTLLALVLVLFLRLPDTPHHDKDNSNPTGDNIPMCSMSCVLLDHYLCSCLDCPEYQSYVNKINKQNETQLPTTEKTDEA